MLLLFKFGIAEHLRAFREHGLLHMRTLRYFAEREENEARRDGFEGTNNLIQPGDVGELSFKSPQTGTFVADTRELCGPLVIRLDKESDLNVFCMFAVTAPRDILEEPENTKFGDSFVLVLNSEEFLKRVAKAADSQQLVWEARMVEYFDAKEYSGKVGPFRKSSQFRHQSEFRIVTRACSH